MLSHNPPPRAAGKVDGKDAMESTVNCLSIEERPNTPEQVRRYRKSYFAEPGAHVVHPGLIYDIQKQDRYSKHGVVTIGSDHVPDVLPFGPQTDFQEILAYKTEANYASHKREPLAKSGLNYNDSQLPSKMKDPAYVFGIRGTFGQSAKELLYPSKSLNNTRDEELYKRSHGSVGPGEQKNREYAWTVEPASHRFGIQSKTRMGNGLGVAGCLQSEDITAKGRSVGTQRMEHMKNQFDVLGRPKRLGANHGEVASNQVFGKFPEKNENESASMCITGSYSYEEQQPDRDLGRAANFGWGNNTKETRAFGLPTVRSDIAKPTRRSIADSQNYGDDVSSQNLLNPEEFAASGVSDLEFAVPRDQTEMKELFANIGYELPDEVFLQVWGHASKLTTYTPEGYVSIVEFRESLNNYLIAKDQGELALMKWKNNL